MYGDYFGFREAPFSIAPDPRYLFMSERHREALAHLLFGVRSDGGFVLVTGEVGTGKTTVCRCLLEQVPDGTDIALVLNPKLTAAELLATIGDELGIPGMAAGASIKTLVDGINTHLLDAHGRGRRTVLIIDEAQNLDAEVLEQIRLLTNLETNSRKLLQIILLGQPELREILARPELRQLSQRITARYHLDPLSRAETAAYVQHRMGVAGMERQLFPAATVAGLYRLSGGIPRLINILCDRALLGAYVQGRDVVDRRTLAKAAREVFGRKEESGGRRPIWLTLAVLGLLGGAMALGSALRQPGPAAVEAPPAVSVPPPVGAPAAVDWLESLSTDRGGKEAFAALFREWGIAYGLGESRPPCDFAGEQGLLCLSETGSFRTLDLLDRPAVLKLFDDRGAGFHAALLGLGEDSAVLAVGGKKESVPLDELRNRWMGEFVLLWRPPPWYPAPLRRGEGGAGVEWLDRQLGRVEARTSPPPERPLFDAALAARVKRFQLAAGLVPDGIVGVRTLIRLDGGDGKAPSLRGRE